LINIEIIERLSCEYYNSKLTKIKFILQIGQYITQNVNKNAYTAQKGLKYMTNIEKMVYAI
jgi:hypothetical protein